MNSLEFINLEIAITNTKYKEHLKFAQFELAIKDEKRLQTLHQIKSELEAWEICKNDPVILSTIKTLAEGKSINWHRLSKEQRESIKKVIEVKDEI